MIQNDLFGNPIPRKGINLVKQGLNVIEDGEFIYHVKYFSKTESDKYLNTLINSIEWRQDRMTMYGKEINFPRLTAWYGNGDKPYTFSGITLPAKVWTPELLEIKASLKSLVEIDFNSVLLNRYRSGDDWISWHQDAEKELGRNPVIASVNFGGTRKFQIRHLRTKEKLDIELGHGSVLVMMGAMQHHWQHQVPKTKKQIGERLNLTFRVIH